ncbi:hypothetical protein NEOLEDRAFT_359523 [Neolentinus lepideus HHB14362 ss-1]|uniref:Terpenoid synthase n=1 Tax=Neolentinus lepideus HHB14362 ss-1 TaxID=1314782 RepID=A0A165SMQ2_9AGAM|nr:hypothetical protein NEOLEDRAFT_359523 [Neolentinus lepideus HHB14362 ss-1]
MQLTKVKACAWHIRPLVHGRRQNILSRSIRWSRRSLTTASPSLGGVGDPGAYCKDLVRKHDYESFLMSPFYPEYLRGGYFALKAFYVELAMLQESVSNSMVGKIRMQFWRDAIKDISDNRPPHHPIALALHDASRRAHLPSYHLKRIVDARDSELQTPSHLTSDSATAHAESTSSTLLYLLLSLLSLQESSTCSHAASHLGVAQSFTTLLRSLPFHASKGRMVIPAEITAKHGVNQEEVFRKGPQADMLSDAVFEFATAANDHLATARDMFKDTGVPKEAMPVFLAAIPVQSYLSRLEAANFNAFDTSLQRGDWKMPWHIWRGYYKSTF